MSEKPQQDKNISRDNNPLTRFLREEQDPETVKSVYSKVKQILTSEEKILYIAVQKPLINLSPDCVVLTNRRFIIYRPTLLGGVNFQDYIWRDLRDAQLSEGIIRATLSMKTVKGGILSIDNLPKIQARKIYAFAQEMEEKVREQRRIRKMEETRAGAGGVILQGTAPSQAAEAVSTEDPMQTLKKLKDMLDANLITTEEFEAKKSEILSRM